MTGLPPPPPRPGSPQSSRLKSGKTRQMLRNAAQWFTHSLLPRKTHENRASEERLVARSRACSLRLRLQLGVPPTPWRAQRLRARRGLGGAGFPPHPPRGAGSPQSLVAATAPPSYAPPAAPPPGMGGGLKTRDGRGASRSQVVPGVPRGWTEGTRCLGLCTRSTDRASCSRAAADHAWPCQLIG